MFKKKKKGKKIILVGKKIQSKLLKIFWDPKYELASPKAGNYTFSLQSPQEGEAWWKWWRRERRWGLRRSDVRASSLQRCHTVSEQHSASCKGSFAQIVLVPRMRKPPALLAFSLQHNSELLSPGKCDKHRRGEDWNRKGLGATLQGFSWSSWC